jgi:hypothetical protein
MTADIPPDVRDRAAQAACVAWQFGWVPSERVEWLAVVDAVAEVLAAEQRPPNDYSGGPLRSERELLLEAQVAELEEELEREQTRQTQSEARVLAERDALKARVAELSTEHLHLSHEVEALEEWNFWLSRTLRDMARRATSFRSSYYRTARESTRYVIERNEARARVDLLTTALTEIAHNDQDPGYLLQRRAQLALSATPTTGNET